MTRHYIGIDPSLRSTGIAIVTNGQGQIDHSEYTLRSGPTAPTILARFMRYTGMVDGIEKIIHNATGQPAMIAIENYSYRSQNGAVAMVELGTLIRAMLLRHGWEIIEIPPASLKKFATGNGRASKVEVATKLATKYGVQFENSDVSDAYGLALMAQCADRPESFTKAQREALHRAIRK